MRRGGNNLRRSAAVAILALLAGIAVRSWGQGPPRLQLPPATATPPVSPGYASPPWPTPGAGVPGSVAPGPSFPGAAPYSPPPFSPPPFSPTPAPYGVPPGYPGYPPVQPYGYPLDPRFSQGPSSWFPNYGPAQPYPNSSGTIFGPDGSIGQYTRFLQGVGLEVTHLAGESGRDLDTNDIDLWATFALKVFPNPNHPLLVSPGFAMHFWEGPARPEAGIADLPPRAYDAYIDFGWRPQFEQIGFELAIRPGLYTDFDALSTDSIRIQGRGIAFVTVTPSLKLALGAIYLDRLDKKLFPAGGVIWTPNERARYEITFPKPKLSRYLLTSARNTQWWVYFTAEYGGGSWTIARVDGFDDQVDINDIRLAMGLDLLPAPSVDGAAPGMTRKFSAYFEAGYVFERELEYKSNMPTEFRLPDTYMLRGGLKY